MYRIDVLLKQKNHLFHTRDLALLWSVTDDNTLYTQIKRYCAKGILVPVQKGLYSTIPLSELNPLVLGQAIIHRYSYVSCEYVLVRAGAIFQNQHAITFVSSVSQKFKSSNSQYVVRKLADRFLYNTIGIRTDADISIASPERAAADMLYFAPRYHFDNRSVINWKEVKDIQKNVGYL